MSEVPRHPRVPLLPVNRIEALTDAMFAIIMTLLVLTINIPTDVTVTTSDQLSEELQNLGPTFFSYVISFGILGFNWIGHHSVYYYIKRSDAMLIWLNFTYMLLVTMIPFTTDLFGEYSRQHLAGVIYVGNVFVVSVLLFFQWWYAAAGKRLIDKDLDPYLLREEYIHRLISPFGFGIAFVVSFANDYVAVAVMIATGFAHLFVRKMANRAADRADAQQASSE